MSIHDQKTNSGTYFRESVKERLGKTFPATTLSRRILTCKNSKCWRAFKGTAQFWDEDLSTMIQNRIQTLERYKFLITLTRIIYVERQQNSTCSRAKKIFTEMKLVACWLTSRTDCGARFSSSNKTHEPSFRACRNCITEGLQVLN